MSSRPRPGSADRMTQLVDLASRQEQVAGVELQEHQVDLDDMVRELSRLKQYRVEYAQGSIREQNLDVMRLRNLQQFIRTLDAAIEQKTTHMVSQQDKVETARIKWLATYQRTDALTRVRDGRRQLERQEQVRLDQITDEELVNSRLGNKQD